VWSRVIGCQWIVNWKVHDKKQSLPNFEVLTLNIYVKELKWTTKNVVRLVGTPVRIRTGYFAWASLRGSKEYLETSWNVFQSFRVRVVRYPQCIPSICLLKASKQFLYPSDPSGMFSAKHSALFWKVVCDCCFEESFLARVFERGYGREGWHFKKRNCVLYKDYWTWKGCGIEFKTARENERFLSVKEWKYLSQRVAEDLIFLFFVVCISVTANVVLWSLNVSTLEMSGACSTNGKYKSACRILVMNLWLTTASHRHIHRWGDNMKDAFKE
jgi:hypothetical protein